MASKVSNGVSAREAALEYLLEHHPELVCHELALLKLEVGWLVETVPLALGDEERSDRVLLMVNRYGFVEEIGSALPRQNAHRFLAGLHPAASSSDASPGPRAGGSAAAPSAIDLREGRQREGWQRASW